jgi:hypothetical protein
MCADVCTRYSAPTRHVRPGYKGTGCAWSRLVTCLTGSWLETLVAPRPMVPTAGGLLADPLAVDTRGVLCALPGMSHAC